MVTKTNYKGATTIKTSDGKLHFYPNLKSSDVINFLNSKGMIEVFNPINNNEFKVVN